MARTITVRGVDRAGRDVVDLVLEHGQDVLVELGARGWSLVAAVGADLVRGGGDDLVVDVVVAPAASGTGEVGVGMVSDPTGDGRGATARDADLALGPGEVAHVHQRLAAYAVITSPAGLLLTRLSANVRGGAGHWTLPGGGVDPGERPHDAVVREVWEETGHAARNVRVIDIQTAHWIGRAPTGRLEDFHAVRLIHRAAVEEVVRPVVHDVGGSTSDAEWVALDRVSELPLTPLVASGVRRWLERGAG